VTNIIKDCKGCTHHEEREDDQQFTAYGTTGRIEMFGGVEKRPACKLKDDFISGDITKECPIIFNSLKIKCAKCPKINIEMDNEPFIFCDIYDNFECEPVNYDCSISLFCIIASMLLVIAILYTVYLEMLRWI